MKSGKIWTVWESFGKFDVIWKYLDNLETVWKMQIPLRTHKNIPDAQNFLVSNANMHATLFLKFISNRETVNFEH